jgi:hypothetical protein
MTLLLVNRDVPFVRAGRHEILERAASQVRDAVIADDLGEFIQFDAGAAAGLADMALEDVVKCRAIHRGEPS